MIFLNWFWRSAWVLESYKGGIRKNFENNCQRAKLLQQHLYKDYPFFDRGKFKTVVKKTLEQRFSNCAPRDFVRGAAKVCESCCTYCFSHNNCSVKIASSNVPSKSFLSVRGMKTVWAVVDIGWGDWGSPPRKQHIQFWIRCRCFFRERFWLKTFFFFFYLENTLIFREK